MYYAIVNINSIVENVIRIKIGITINIGASVKKTLCVRKRLYFKSCYMLL